MGNKLFFLLGQGFLSCISPLIVMIQSRYDHHAAALLSISLSIVGVIFSISYFGQRAYIAVKGNTEISYNVAGAFRIWSIFIATIVSIVFCYMFKLPAVILLLLIIVKMSESMIDFWNGVMIYELGSHKSGKSFCYISFSRALFLISPVLLFKGFTTHPGALASVFTMTVMLTLFYCRQSIFPYLKNKSIAITNLPKLLNASGKMFPFVLSVTVCTMLAALPRWSLAILPHGEYYVVDAIALSITPVLALAYQALWVSNLSNLTKNFIAGLNILALQTILTSVLLLMTYPIWKLFIHVLYKIYDSNLVHRFEEIIIASIVLFAIMCMQNVYKAIKPIFESIGYIFGIIFLLFSIFILKQTIIFSLFFSAIGMSFNLLFLFKLCKRK